MKLIRSFIALAIFASLVIAPSAEATTTWAGFFSSINSIQTGNCTTNSSGNCTVTISSVNTAKSIVLSNGVGGATAPTAYVLTLTNATTVTCQNYNGTSSQICYFTVVQYN